MDTEYENLPASSPGTLPAEKRKGGPGRPPGKRTTKRLLREKLLLEIEKQAAAISNIDVMDLIAVLEHLT